MNTTLLEKQFARMGARLKVSLRPTTRRTRFTGFAVDIGKDGHGPFFDHPDHKTVKLDGWHRVVPNTESQAASMRHLRFLD